MDKKQLIESAEQIKFVSKKTYSEYQEKQYKLISEINEAMLSRPDLANLIGEDNVSMMKDNHANHVRFISSILKNHNSEVLVETILWVFRAYPNHGFSSNYWAAQLNAWITIIKEVLSPESYEEVYQYYEWMQINIPFFVKLSAEKLNDSNVDFHHNN